MKKAVFIIISVVMLITLQNSVSFGCENDREVDGYFWTFHRMDDGNSYHECVLRKAYREGSSLVLSMPCFNRYVDAVQIEWSDKHGKMKGRVILYPGNKILSKRDISSKRRETWAINQKLKKLEIEFMGPRDQTCFIKWIRVFYGKHQASPGGLSLIKNKHKNQQWKKFKLIDRIKLYDGAVERKCRVLSWNGNFFTVVLKKNGKKVKEQLKPEQIEHITFAERWGTATGLNGKSVPFKAKRFKKNMIWFDKKEGSRIISKTDYPIEKFAKITFNR